MYQDLSSRVLKLISLKSIVNLFQRLLGKLPNIHIQLFAKFIYFLKILPTVVWKTGLSYQFEACQLVKLIDHNQQ